MNYKTGLRTIREMNIAGGAGNVFGYGGAGSNIGTSAGGLYNADTYAPGDSRIPKVIGAGGNDPYENVDKGKKGKKGKANRKKLQSKVHVYRRTFSEMMALESTEETYNLNCMFFTEDVMYQQIIIDLLEKQGVTYNQEGELNCVTIEGTDTHIQSIIEKIQSVITEEPFKTLKIFALIGEMDVNMCASFKHPKKKPEEYDQVQLRRGIKIEHEHTNDEKVAALIAMNHLDEFPNYYSALDKMEHKLKKRSQ